VTCDRKGTGDRGQSRALFRPGKERPDRALRDIEQSGHHDRPDAGDVLQAASRHRADAMLAEIGGARQPGHDLGEGMAPAKYEASSTATEPAHLLPVTATECRPNDHEANSADGFERLTLDRTADAI
jgi:hypothetical protein